MARRYYQKLYKEYCIGDLSHYKTGQVGLRWRTEKEVLSGKGQTSCGAKGCGNTQGLEPFEVDFEYPEDGETKRALVKLSLCPECAKKLSYVNDKKKRRKDAHRRHKHHNKKRRHSNSSSSSSSSSSSDYSGDTKKREGKRSGLHDKNEESPFHLAKKKERKI